MNFSCDFFEGGINTEVIQDGGKILGHVLGDNQINIKCALDSKSRIDTDSAWKI